MFPSNEGYSATFDKEITDKLTKAMQNIAPKMAESLRESLSSIDFDSILKEQNEQISKALVDSLVKVDFEGIQKRQAIHFSKILKKLSSTDWDSHAIQTLEKYPVTKLLEPYLNTALDRYRDGDTTGTLLGLYPYIEGIATETLRIVGAPGDAETLFSQKLFTKLEEILQETNPEAKAAIAESIRNPWYPRGHDKADPHGRNPICHGQITSVPPASTVTKVLLSAAWMLEIYRDCIGEKAQTFK